MSEEIQPENKTNNAIYVSASILIASLIIGGAIFVSGGNISDNLTGLSGLASAKDTIKTGNETGNVAAPTQENDGAKILNMKSLIKSGAATAGSDDAEIVLIEYSDYQCPFCRSWYSQSKAQLDSEFIETGKVQLIYKDFPLSFHPMAQTYAEATRCAGEQDKYWEMHNKVFDEQNKFGNGTVTSLSKDDVKKWASEIGIDSGKFNSCLDAGKYASEIQANFSEGQQIGISGTPSFVIGKRDGTGQIIVGAQPYSVFKNAINSLTT